MAFEIDPKERKAFTTEMRPHLQRFWRSFLFPEHPQSDRPGKRDTPGHAYVNLWVEAARLPRATRGAYLVGHTAAVATPWAIAATAAWLYLLIR